MIHQKLCRSFALVFSLPLIGSMVLACACQSASSGTSALPDEQADEGGQAGQSTNDVNNEGGRGGAAQAGIGGSMAAAGSGGKGPDAGGAPVVSSPPDAGMPDAASSPFDPKTSFASAFAGFRWEVPCDSATHVTADDCSWDATRFSKAFRKEVRFAGDAGKLYDVNVRIRGVVEPRTYTVNGQIANANGAKPAWVVDAVPVPGNDYNVYRIVVSKPSKTYVLNAYKQVGHMIFDIDYPATMTIEGGATVVLEAIDSNTKAIANFKRLVVPNVPPAPLPYNGQFIQLDVTGLSLHKD